MLQNDNEAGFSLRHRDEETFHEDAEILLTIPSFSLFITGDLSFYADVLGMPNSSSYWCPWCLISHKEWQSDPQTFVAEPRTAKFLEETYKAVKNDVRISQPQHQNVKRKKKSNEKVKNLNVNHT